VLRKEPDFVVQQTPPKQRRVFEHKKEHKSHGRSNVTYRDNSGKSSKGHSLWVLRKEPDFMVQQTPPKQR